MSDDELVEELRQRLSRGAKALELWKNAKEPEEDGSGYCTMCDGHCNNHKPDCPWLLSRELIKNDGLTPPASQA
jgi:hypothetical protein